MLDVGAGTGKLTAALVAVGADVVAVEPDPAMLAELRRTLPAVRALAGSAEAVPLPDGSVDAVVAGNAMHWFDMDVAGPEIARVLAPAVSARQRLNVSRPPMAAQFGAPEQDEFPHGQRRTAESLVATFATKAGVLLMAEPDREATLGRIRDFLTSTPETAAGEFTLPMLTGVLRTRRL